MNNYTPTTEEVREQFWVASGTRRRDPEAWGEFDRWLSAHDVEVREHARHEFCDRRLGCVVAEEPEWEWGYRLVGDDGNVYKTGFAYDNRAEPLDRAKMRAAEENAVRKETGEPLLSPELIRRRKAGPWVPVEQEGQVER